MVNCRRAEGADVNAPSTDGRTPLHRAVKYKKLEVAELLLKRGADPNARDNTGKTPRELAMEKNHPEIVPLFKDYPPR
ncbi:MAG: ankyrin repeat domain-containing protein, partial [Nitrospinaceae bacterium]|nr:ankyrin repeat domain-containing protein [Nitrospinaceae bacterium]NIR57189.1 ankyrin repeat domain-containing protein [Nitrospinaceae bacterium]NIS87631.1 ankyrin repeat domain-containing protein [Nitrospinaceae bacterium]NIT84499.1 ankyrin repeat domain-containing protein [Nitrospinaceae bacterium]NIU46688.1 ankyrin repeat domain-containing protein [Nitrospinaceae bacterium]